MARKLTKAQQSERTEALEELRELLAAGDTVYSIVRSVARSGMSREISFVIFYVRPGAPRGEGPTPRYLSRAISLALGWRMSRRDRAAIVVNGCGMDMCFHTLDCVRAALGYKVQFRSEQL